MIFLQLSIHMSKSTVKRFVCIHFHFSLLQIQMYRDSEQVDLRLVLNGNVTNVNGDDHRRYNAPTTAEVAAIIPGDGREGIQTRDLVLTTKQGNLRRIYETHPSHDPLHYVLMFPLGTNGWTYLLKQTNGRKKVYLKKSIYFT